MANMVIEAKAQDINFVTRFEKDIQHLLDVLGKTSVEVVAPGTAFKVYETSGTLSATAVAEKALIPDSNIAVGNPTTIEIAYKKYRNLTSIEKIGKVGYDLAVGKTNDDMLKQVQNGIRASIFAGLATGTGTATGASFQAAIAAAAAQVAVKFEAEVATPVFFVNPADLYGYLGTHNVTLESEFGLNYLKNFMGIGNVIADSNVPSGKVYGTAVENLTVGHALRSVNGMIARHHTLTACLTDHRLVGQQDLLHQFLLVGITTATIAEVVLRTGADTFLQVTLLQTLHKGYAHGCRQIAVFAIGLFQTVEGGVTTHVDHR